MNFLRFITIENLCVAAEITTALLLLALAIPEKKKTASNLPIPDDSESLRRLEAARQAHCQAIVYRGIAVLLGRGKEDSNADRFHLYEPLSLLGWEDRLTKLGNRSFLDAVLDAWLSLPEQTRNGSLLTMIVVDRYTELLRERGAIGVEQSLRDFGEKLSHHYESTAIIGRYQPDRFLVFQFERTLPQAHEDFEALLMSLEERTVEDRQDSSPSPHATICCLASIVELGEEGLSLSSSVDKLDEGVSQAIESGATCVSEFEGTWTNKRPMLDYATSVPPPPNSAPTDDTDPALQERRRAASIDSPPPEPSSKRESLEESNTPEVASPIDDLSKDRSGLSTQDEEKGEQANANIPEPTDVSAVASSEDIAALFAQINKKKQEVSPPPAPTPAPTPSPAPASASASSPEPAAPPSVEDANDQVVNADDIAALFAANAPKKKSEPVPAQPSVAPKADGKLNELLNNLHQDVSNDDLESLFANIS